MLFFKSKERRMLERAIHVASSLGKQIITLGLFEDDAYVAVSLDSILLFRGFCEYIDDTSIPGFVLYEDISTVEIRNERSEEEEEEEEDEY